jgi:hypothetical protein
MTPEKRKYYLERAAECEALAEWARGTKHRDILLYVAATWQRLAEEEEHEFPHYGGGKRISPDEV